MSGTMRQRKKALKRKKNRKVSKRTRLCRTACWYCGNMIIWDSDFNPEDCGYDGEGIVTYLHCSECGANIEYSILDNE